MATTAASLMGHLVSENSCFIVTMFCDRNHRAYIKYISMIVTTTVHLGAVQQLRSA